MNTYKQLLKTAANLSFVVALFQAVVTAVPEWARYFGAWDAVASTVWLLYLTGPFAATIFALFGLYALSGAGSIRRLPMFRTGLITIGVVYTLRNAFYNYGIGSKELNEVRASMDCKEWRSP